MDENDANDVIKKVQDNIGKEQTSQDDINVEPEQSEKQEPQLQTPTNNNGQPKVESKMVKKVVKEENKTLDQVIEEIYCEEYGDDSVENEKQLLRKKDIFKAPKFK